MASMSWTLSSKRHERAALLGYYEGAFPDPEWEGRAPSFRHFVWLPHCMAYYWAAFRKGCRDREYRKQRFGTY